MFEVKAIVRVDRQDEVIHALHCVPDLPGLIVSVVEGVGRRHMGDAGRAGAYGRVRMSKIEIVVAEAQLDAVLEALKQSAHTGGPGDGKVFVLPVAQAVRLRTGETGLAALQ